MAEALDNLSVRPIVIENFLEFSNYVHFLAASQEEYRDEFLDFFVTSKSSFFRLVKRQSPDHEIKKFLVKKWIARQKHRSLRESLSWEEKYLIFSIFIQKKDLSFAQRVLSINSSSVRYRLFEALKKFANLDKSLFRSLSRDCVRFDLNWVDFYFDPEKFNRETFLVFDCPGHLKGCKRCSATDRQLRAALKSMRQQNDPSLFSEYERYLEQEFSQSPLVGRSFWSEWPLAVKIVVQATLVLVISVSVVSVPYYRDIVHRLQRLRNTEVASSAAPSATSQPLPAAPPIHVAVVPPNAAAVNLPITAKPATGTENVAAPALVAVGAQLPTNAKSEVAAKAAIKTETKMENKAAVPSEAKPVATAPAAAESTPDAVTPVAVDKTPKREVTKVFFRWDGYYTREDEDPIDISELLRKHKAEKAGDLILGADYLGGRYYHFSVPNEEYTALFKDMQDLDLENFSSVKATGEKSVSVDRTRIVMLIKLKRKKEDPKGQEQ